MPNLTWHLNSPPPSPPPKNWNPLNNPVSIPEPFRHRKYVQDDVSIRIMKEPTVLVTLSTQIISTRWLAVWRKSVSGYFFFLTLKQMHLPFLGRIILPLTMTYLQKTNSPSRLLSNIWFSISWSSWIGILLLTVGHFKADPPPSDASCISVLASLPMNRFFRNYKFDFYVNIFFLSSQALQSPTKKRTVFRRGILSINKSWKLI